MSYFSPYANFTNEIKVDLDLPNYATKSDLKNATGVDTLQLAKKGNSPNLKSDVDELDTD